MERSLRNVLVVSFGFLLLFTAYGGLQNLQSSLYSEDGMGVATLGTLYGAVLLSSMFLPPILIKRCGCKWTIVGSMCCYVAFSLGNFYASWYPPSRKPQGLELFLSPSREGYGWALLSRPSVPVLHVSPAQTVLRGHCHEAMETTGHRLRLFAPDPAEATPEEHLESCGANDCLMATAPTNSTHRPSQELIYTLLGIYTGIGVLAILLTAVFLEATEDSGSQNEAETKPPRLGSTLLSTFKLFRDKRLCLLTLLPMYSGLQQGFLSGEYTRSFVTCVLGIQFVGYVMICFSASTALCSLLFGRLSHYTGRRAIYVLGAATHLSCIVALLLWRPRSSQMAVFFLLPGLWGMGDAVWQTQNNGE
ncbi:hypothetical protein H1C71_027060 [Ictidomys tridecemlineatus]|uniref:protein unc-93 homolog A-like n=1 Tax=Ictidomys tridecemlineatus TaxID=43179 RepID=UPI000B54548C|nr:protein unc-93 homolog A-like [Ictidomys tridecemlineatus]KAG3290597.1 hypothetical protein H1C71_027060 [Ictidomys tridecemlineatus]